MGRPGAWVNRTPVKEEINMISENTREEAPEWIEEVINTLRELIWEIGHISREAYTDLRKACHSYRPTLLLDSDLDAFNYILNYGLHEILELREVYIGETQEDA